MQLVIEHKLKISRVIYINLQKRNWQILYNIIIQPSTQQIRSKQISIIL
jgi:hypothetical protein